MLNHPLFNPESDPERAKLDIEYINIRRFVGNGKSEMLTNQWDPESLQTALDVFNAVGQIEGRYELIGRNRQNRIVDREVINIKAPVGFQAAPKPLEPQAQPVNGSAPSQSVPMMTAGGLLIPANMDPSVAMVISMMTMQSQQTQAMMQQARQDAQNASNTMMQLFLAMQNNSSNVMSTAITALAPLLAQRATPAGENSVGTQEGFLKGIEVMAALKEGVDGATKAGQTTDWSVVSSNILNGIKTLSEITKTTAGAAPVPQVPPIPPGP